MSEPAPDRQAARPMCAIIIGAASGVGEEFARSLAARGTRLLLVDRDEFALARLRHELGADAVFCDVLDEMGVSAMFDAAERLFDHVDLLINSAGSGYVRTLGVMRASREFARRPRMQRAFVVNVAARPDDVSGPFEYAGSEVAFHRLTEGLARAIESSELRVLTVDRVANPAAVADLTEQLVRQMTADPQPSTRRVQSSR